jgi:hypothetical protein
MFPMKIRPPAYLSSAVPIAARNPLSMAVASLLITLALLPAVTTAEAVPGLTREDSAVEDRDIMETADRLASVLLRDALDIATAPSRIDRRDVPILLAVFGGIGALAAQDGEIRDQLQSDGLNLLDRSGDALDYLGRVGVNQQISVGLYVTGRLAQSPRLERAGVLGLESSLFTVLITSALKEVCGRSRPSESSRPNHFHAFGGGGSLPSSHAAQAFSLATVLSNAYGARAAVAFYGLATLVALADIQADLHWASDAAVGASVGIFVAKILCSAHPAHERAGKGLSLGLRTGSGTPTLAAAVTYAF